MAMAARLTILAALKKNLKNSLAKLKGATIVAPFWMQMCYNSFMVKSHKKNSEPEAVATPVEATRKKHTMPAVYRVLFSFLLLAFFSVIFTWFLFWRTNLCDAETANEFIQEHQDIAIYSYLVIFCVMAVVAAATWRPFFTVGLSFVLLSIITFIHIQKFTLRNAPLLPEDFQLADSVGNLVEFVDGGAIARLIWGVVFILAGSILLEYCARKVCGRERRGLPWWEKYSLIPRVTWTLVAITVLAGITKPVLEHTKLDWVEGVEYVSWNQTANYADNGFVIGFIYNLSRLSIPEPEGYTAERMSEIAEKYRALKAADTERKPLDEIVQNVIFIMDETFYDPALLTKYYPHTGGDVTPVLHQIFREYPSGYMYSPVYGGSTANVEFEGQTGLSNFWAQTTPYVTSLARVDGVLAIAEWAKGFGFGTTAIHAYDGTMYKRYLVYPKFGYDTFIDAAMMNYTEKEGESSYTNDRSVYNEIYDILTENSGPQLVAAVTMQNHSPYEGAHYQNLKFKILTNDPDAWYLEPNFQSIHNADKYIGELLEKLDELDEKTVLIWFGDHAMGLLNKYTSSEEKADRDIVHFTPYFIYTNFELENPYTVTDVAKLNAALGFTFPTRGVDLPTTTPNCLLNSMYNLLDAQKPALFYLLDTICEKTPVLARSYWAGEELESYPELEEYELVNYDVLSGKHYWDGN